jgi:maleylacetate reductase
MWGARAKTTTRTGFIYPAQRGRVVFGAGASRVRLRDEIDQFGFRRVMLLATDHRRGLAQRIAAPLGGRAIGIFSAIRPHVPVDVADAALARAVELDADCLLSIGGGSTIGAAKAVALHTGLPIIAVPTTYAGSEMTPIYGVTTNGNKETGTSPNVLPRLVVYDPELTRSLPPRVAAASAMNALAHSVEALYAPGANPVTTLLALESIRVLFAALPVLIDRPEDLDPSSSTLYGAYLAGSALGVAGAGLHHKICHVLGGAYNLPHAETHAVVLPHVVALQERLRPEAMKRIASEVGAARASAAIHTLARRLGVPVRLSDFGMDPEDLSPAIERTLATISDRGGASPRDLEMILRRAFAGEPPQ